MNIRYILCALGGAGVGAGITALVFKKRIKKMEEDGKKVTDQTHEAVKNIRENVETVSNNIDMYSASMDAALEEAEHYKTLYYDLLRKDYEKTQNDIPDSPVTLAPEEDPCSEMDAYAITVADFMDDVKYDKVYCEYYRESDSLVDTSSETEIDQRKALGEMSEMLPGWVGSEMYIRNTRTGTDYQIDFLPGTFGGGD